MPETKNSLPEPKLSEKRPLKQALASHFIELTEKIFKKALKVSELERFQVVIANISSEILTHAERIAIVKCKAINDAIKKGFRLIGTDMEELTNRVDELESQVKAQHHCLKEWMTSSDKRMDASVKRETADTKL